MPRMTIINIDGETVVVDTHQGLLLELGFFETAMEELEGALAGDDDREGDIASEEFDRLAAAHRRIVEQLPQWNVDVIEERRAARKTKAAEVRERRLCRMKARIVDGDVAADSD